MMSAKTRVEIVVNNCDPTIIVFLFIRSARVPPKNENIAEGIRKDSMTHVSAISDSVKSNINQPRAKICIFMANDDAILVSQIKRKSRYCSASKVREAKLGDLIDFCKEVVFCVEAIECCSVLY